MCQYIRRGEGCYPIVYILYAVIVCASAPFLNGRNAVYGLVIGLAFLPILMSFCHLISLGKKGTRRHFLVIFAVWASIFPAFLPLCIGLNSLAIWAPSPVTADGLTVANVVSNPNVQYFTNLQGSYVTSAAVTAGPGSFGPFDCDCNTKGRCVPCWLVGAAVPIQSPGDAALSSGSTAGYWMVSYMMYKGDAAPNPAVGDLFSNFNSLDYGWRFRPDKDYARSPNGNKHDEFSLINLFNGMIATAASAKGYVVPPDKVVLIHFDVASWNKTYTGYVIGGAVVAGLALLGWVIYSIYACSKDCKRAMGGRGNVPESPPPSEKEYSEKAASDASNAEGSDDESKSKKSNKPAAKGKEKKGGGTGTRAGADISIEASV